MFFRTTAVRPRVVSFARERVIMLLGGRQLLFLFFSSRRFLRLTFLLSGNNCTSFGFDNGGGTRPSGVLIFAVESNGPLFKVGFSNGGRGGSGFAVPVIAFVRKAGGTIFDFITGIFRKGFTTVGFEGGLGNFGDFSSDLGDSFFRLEIPTIVGGTGFANKVILRFVGLLGRRKGILKSGFFGFAFVLEFGFSP